MIQEGAYFLHCSAAVAGDAAAPLAQLEIAESQYLLQTSMALSSKVSRGALGWVLRGALDSFWHLLVCQPKKYPEGHVGSVTG